jgi:hypothetical protein
MKPWHDSKFDFGLCSILVFVNLNLREEKEKLKMEEKGKAVTKQLVVCGRCHCSKNNS